MATVEHDTNNANIAIVILSRAFRRSACPELAEGTSGDA
jgi:hypothetical protein